MDIQARRERRGWKQRDGFWLRLAALAVFFSVGIFLGQVIAVHIPDGTGQELERYFRDYVSLDPGEAACGQKLLSVILIYFRYPVMAFLLGFVSAGVLFIPILTVTYGFFLSFAVCCFAAAFGKSGILLAAAVFGFRCLWTLPCYFALAVPAVHRASILMGRHFVRGKRIQQAAEPVSWLLILAVFLCLSVGVFLEVTLCPRIVCAALANLLL